MTNELRKQMLNAAERGRLYDFIANEYWQLSKDDIVNIAKECAYIIVSGRQDTLRDTLIELADNLSDCIVEDDE